MSNPALSPASLSPAMFSVVLGTGGLSLTANLIGLPRVALLLFWLNVGLLALAWGATVVRTLRGLREMVDDFTHAGRGPSFFLAVLATSIFGLQVCVVAPWPEAVAPIWIFSTALWVVLISCFVVGVTVRADKPEFAAVMGPAWFLPGAALEATVALGTHVSTHSSRLLDTALLGGFLLGLLLNLLVLAAVLYRWLFVPMSAEQLVATNWINMGGFAIIVVAGVKLASPRLETFIVLSWSIATWWLPILCIGGVWRHAVRKVPLRYDAQYWPVVFSPAVYASGTFLVAEASRLSTLYWIPPLFFAFAAAVWVILMIGLCRSFLRPS